MEIKIGSVAKLTDEFSLKIFSDPTKRDINNQVIIIALTDSSVAIKSLITNEMTTVRTQDFIRAVKWFGNPTAIQAKSPKLKPSVKPKEKTSDTANVNIQPTSSPSNVSGEADVQIYTEDGFIVYCQTSGKVKFRQSITLTSFEDAEFDPYGGANDPYGF